MAWIESHQVLDRHPKVLMLMSLMRWDKPYTIGQLHRFWWWCVDYAEDGDLRRYHADQIGAALDIPAGKEANKFLESMITTRWIDTEPYLRVHDWWRYIGRFLQVKYKMHPEKWKAIKELYANNPPNNGCNNHIPNLTIPNLTIKKQPYWAVFKPESQKLMDSVYKKFNIYKILTKIKKDTKAELPEEVVVRICNGYLKNPEKIKAEWPWFMKALKSAWEQWNAERNIQEGAQFKAMSMTPEIKALIAQVLKSKGQTNVR